MQGLPIDELLLTRESEDNLRDLAGNAMTSTVVGASIIAALIVGCKHITPGTGKVEVMDIDDEGTTHNSQLTLQRILQVALPGKINSPQVPSISRK